ncbi:MAG: hypothetical protein L3J52_04325, partial [Proteobacteria bacterium]|nr:hypothetical protein [Pseudomonadota bacterium]
MKNKTQQNNIENLYQLENQELPPESLDSFILNRAKTKKHQFNKWPKFTIAASILIAIPLILQMQNFNEQSIAPEKFNKEITETSISTENEEVLTRAKTPKTQLAEKKLDSTSPVFDSIEKSETLKPAGSIADAEITKPSPVTEESENRITVTGSRLKSADMEDEKE